MQISGQMPVVPVLTPDVSTAKAPASAVAPEALVSTLAPAQPLEAAAVTGSATQSPLVYARPRVRQSMDEGVEQRGNQPASDTGRSRAGTGGNEAAGAPPADQDGAAAKKADQSPGANPSRPDAGSAPASGAPDAGGKADPAVLAQIRRLSQIDQQVKQHEQAHASVGGQLAGAPSFDFETGPDGRRYAVAGEVPIDASPVPGNPEATLRKMEQVRRAALAPADPSPQDRLVAAKATQAMLQARAEMLAQQRERMREAGATGDNRNPRQRQTALDTYRQLNESGAPSSIPAVPDLAELIG
ncbi:putative metalloprotease CJM1_0395 family protein [Hahella sp. SMD15-11]|uniref:Metalloprotease CJM1_0395 family protein n=1 Tax=Thermohahella caldifontis TaxID=3142973 RepID=A0AB39UZZ2_9GAMM